MSSITKPTRYLKKTLAHYRQIEVVKKTFSKLPIKAFKKDTSLKQTIDTNTIHNNKKLIKIKVITKQIRVPHGTHNIAFAVNNFNTLVNQKHHSRLDSIKDVRNPNAIPAFKHFNKLDHELKNYRKFIIEELLKNILTKSTETLKERLKQ